MSVFISYSSKDSLFIDKLSNKLIENRIPVWLDKWEMQPGDSLIDKIQHGLEDSSYLLVVLSKNSIQSEWCKKELNSGLMRELNEKKVVVIPVLIEECKVPLLLQEKVYADFKTDFKKGFNDLMRPLYKLFSENIGRVNKKDIITDYAINWGLKNNLYSLEIDLINWYPAANKSILIQINVEGCKKATERFLNQVNMGKYWLMHESIISMMVVNDDFRNLNIRTKSDKVFYEYIESKDLKMNITFKITIRAVMMGLDDGNDVFLNFVDFLEMLDQSRVERKY